MLRRAEDVVLFPKQRCWIWIAVHSLNVILNLLQFIPIIGESSEFRNILKFAFGRVE